MSRLITCTPNNTFLNQLNSTEENNYNTLVCSSDKYNNIFSERFPLIRLWIYLNIYCQQYKSIDSFSSVWTIQSHNERLESCFIPRNDKCFLCINKFLLYIVRMWACTKLQHFAAKKRQESELTTTKINLKWQVARKMSLNYCLSPNLTIFIMSHFRI